MIQIDIDDLKDLDLAGLKAMWKMVMGVDPPRGISSRLMIRALAYEMQVQQSRGLKRTILSKLSRIVSDGGGDALSVGRAAGPKPQLTPGTRLVREWNGATHIVDVIDGGFEWRGQVYGSLSHIAREITGARWSGPRFFGLNGKVAA